MGYKLKRITIRQDTSWKPGANTVAYYPLTSSSTVNDESEGTTYNLITTHTSPTFGTYNGVDCAYFDGSSTELHNTSLNPSAYGSEFTIGFWFFPSSDQAVSSSPICNLYRNNNSWNNWLVAHENQSYFYLRYSYSGINTGISKGANARNHITATYKNGVYSCYSNGVLQGTASVNNLANSGNFTIGCGQDNNAGGDWWYWFFKGGISNIIVENVARTAEEIQNYYNSTKGNYGYTPEPTLIEKQIRPKLIPATAITLNESLINMKTIGDTYQLVATLTPADSTSSVTWSSDDTSIATVDDTGLVTCVTPGECTITAETDNGLTASCDVTNKWIPGANTIAYYPLNSTTTVNDMSSNSRNLTKEDPYGNVHFGTYDNVDCCYMNGGRFNYASMPSIVSGTILLYVNTHSASNNTNTAIINRQFNSTYSYWALKLYASGTYLEYVYPTALNNIGTYGTSNTTATWMLLTIVKNNGSYKVYKNGVLLSTKNGYGGSSNTNFYIGQDGQNGSYYFNGSISNVIIEDKVWTASEIQDYFNNTKSIYGIS